MPGRGDKSLPSAAPTSLWSGLASLSVIGRQQGREAASSSLWLRRGPESRLPHRLRAAGAPLGPPWGLQDTHQVLDSCEALLSVEVPPPALGHEKEAAREEQAEYLAGLLGSWCQQCGLRLFPSALRLCPAARGVASPLGTRKQVVGWS